MTILTFQNQVAERENKENNRVCVGDFSSCFSRVQSGLEYILNHFSESHFPRNVSTAATRNVQKPVNDKDRAMLYYQGALWEDCRIAAFRIGQENPDLIFIDLDAKDFPSMRSFKSALTRTLKNIEKKIGGHPTVIWSGRGYHIIQPIDCPIALEEIKEVVELEPTTTTNNISNAFLQFAESYLSNNKQDKGHHPAIKSCMLRVPYSLNSRCKAAGALDAEVKILQKWDGYRPDIKLLIGSFCAYLVGKTKKLERQTPTIPSLSNNAASTPWIEKLLSQTPIEDYRKITVTLILSRYLTNVKKLGYEQRYEIIWDWLDRCAKLRKLEPSRNHFDHYVVRYQLEEARRSKRLPMKLETLKECNLDLYKKLSMSGGDIGK
jgi:hypothetical protein